MKGREVIRARRKAGSGCGRREKQRKRSGGKGTERRRKEARETVARRMKLRQAREGCVQVEVREIRKD